MELRTLPAELSGLVSLQTLQLSWGGEALPETLGDLSSLRTLRLDACLSLEALPDSLTRLTDLQVRRERIAYFCAGGGGGGGG